MTYTGKFAMSWSSVLVFDVRSAIQAKAVVSAINGGRDYINRSLML